MIKQRQIDLTNRLDTASRLYYDGKTTEFSDAEFDLLFKELQSLETESKEVLPNSPTLRVGSDLQKEFKKGKHAVPMLTIENTYSDEELSEWVKKMYDKYHCTFNASVKYDGVSCELKYVDGIFTQALTRGDKLVGDDITENVKKIMDVPMNLDRRWLLGKTLYVRGEVLMPKSRLAKLNAENEANGEKLFANTRNACSGSLKQLDTRITARRGLIFRAWDCFSEDDAHSFISMTEKANWLSRIGFKFEDNTMPFSRTHVDIVEYVSAFKKKLDSLNLDYDYDGIVIKVDEMDVQNKIGIKDTRAIEWGIARKWNEEYEVKTILNDVDWQVGRTGNVTPVARLKPVEVGGVIVENCTLHNIDFIKGLGLSYGSIVTLTRSGGVIPYILDAELPVAEQSKPIEIPSVCPICGQPLVMDGKILKCTNKSCAAQERGKVLQFCSKDCMDIKSVGEAVVDDLFDKGIISSLSDFISLGASSEYSVESLAEKLGDGYGLKKVQNIFEGISKAKMEKNWANLLASLSIPNVGKVMARALAAKYDDINKFLNADIEGLNRIDGVGEIVAEGIVEWISKEENQYLMDELHYWGWPWMNEAFDIDEAEAEEDNRPLEGLSVVFTGASSRFAGDTVEAFLESKGAKCGHSVSKKTDYLIIGNKPGGSKLAKAADLDVEIISENEFYEKFHLEGISVEDKNESAAYVHWKRKTYIAEKNNENWNFWEEESNDLANEGESYCGDIHDLDSLEKFFNEWIYI